MSDENVVKFTPRTLGLWAKQIYLADFDDGNGLKVYDHIQHPDDTTPKYVRADLYDALLIRAEKAEAAIRGLQRMLEGQRIAYFAEREHDEEEGDE